MRRLPVLLLLVSASAYANETSGSVLQATHAQAVTVVRAEPFPDALRAEILAHMANVVANLALGGTRIVYNVFDARGAMIELDHGTHASELAVSAVARDGHVLTSTDRLGWRFFPANAAGTAEVLRFDRGYQQPRRSEWYRVTKRGVVRIDERVGEQLERNQHGRFVKAELKRLGLRK